jgi:hypothetical protein
MYQYDSTDFPNPNHERCTACVPLFISSKTSGIEDKNCFFIVSIFSFIFDVFGLVVIKDKNVIVNVNERIKMEDAFDDMPNLAPSVVNVEVALTNHATTASLPPLLITANWDAIESETIADTVPYEDEYTGEEGVEGEGREGIEGREEETEASASATFIRSVIATGGIEQEQLVRNLLDLINPPTTNTDVGDILGRMMGSTQEPSITLERLSQGLSLSSGVLRALSSSSSSYFPFYVFNSNYYPNPLKRPHHCDRVQAICN